MCFWDETKLMLYVWLEGRKKICEIQIKLQYIFNSWLFLGRLGGEGEYESMLKRIGVLIEVGPSVETKLEG